jgi:hypothetical protein
VAEGEPVERIARKRDEMTSVRRLARVISIVGHPFATMLALAWVAGARGGFRREALLVGAGVIIPIAVVIVQRRRAGAWRTVDASDRRDRPILYGIAVAAASAVLVTTLLRRELVAARFIAGVLFVFGAAAAANRWVKTSLHVAFAAFGAGSLLYLGSHTGWAFLVLLPPLAWSRVRLERHTAIEVAAGAALGLMAALLVAFP